MPILSLRRIESRFVFEFVSIGLFLTSLSYSNIGVLQRCLQQHHFVHYKSRLWFFWVWLQHQLHNFWTRQGQKLCKYVRFLEDIQLRLRIQLCFYWGKLQMINQYHHNFWSWKYLYCPYKLQELYHYWSRNRRNLSLFGIDHHKYW